MMILLIASMLFQAVDTKTDSTGRYGRTASAQTDKEETPVKDLPYADGHAFATLDAYLAYLRDYAAPMDRPWYREVRPGVYRLGTGNLTDAQAQEFTRAELEVRFGFRR